MSTFLNIIGVMYLTIYIVILVCSIPYVADLILGNKSLRYSIKNMMWLDVVVDFIFLPNVLTVLLVYSLYRILKWSYENLKIKKLIKYLGSKPVFKEKGEK